MDPPHFYQRELEQLDGVDFDWEIPQTPDQRRNFQLLIQEAYNELYIKAGILISVALHARQTFPPEFYEHVTRIHLMAYDMIYDASGGHHATILNMKKAIKMLEAAKCPKAHVVIGIPAYARHGTNPGDVKTYSELIDSMEKQGDADRNVITSRSDWKGYLFDSPRDVRRKVDFAMEDGYAGVFFWELGQDKQHEDLAPGGILLEEASNHARRRRGRPKSSSSEL
jgi:GH18 family chitinase